MRKFGIRAVAFSFVGFLSEALAAADDKCLEYVPGKVTLTEIITRHEDFGPPGYGETPASDARESYWYLNLDHPVCVNGSPDMEAERGIRTMQLVFSEGYPAGGDWINHRASITGTLFHAFTGHHHTPVLITVGEAKKATE